MPKRSENPFSMECYPELDESLILGPDEASCYQSFIGVMRWMVVIGSIDINTKVSPILLFLAMPR